MTPVLAVLQVRAKRKIKFKSRFACFCNNFKIPLILSNEKQCLKPTTLKKSRSKHLNSFINDLAKKDEKSIKNVINSAPSLYLRTQKKS